MTTKNWQLIGCIFTIILGTLLHFTYDFSARNQLVGLFSAINESTWEHLKLLATPMIMCFTFEYFSYGKSIDNFIVIRVLSILIGMSMIVISFYTYVGIIGTHFLWADIATFFIGVFCAYLFSYRYIDTDFLFLPKYKKIFVGVFLLLIASIILFTYYPPALGLFQDPTLVTICE